MAYETTHENEAVRLVTNGFRCTNHNDRMANIAAAQVYADLAKATALDKLVDAITVNTGNALHDIKTAIEVLH